MKKILLFLLLSVCSFAGRAQQRMPAKNIIVITLDGFRWQEMFGGVDAELVRNKDFNQGDSARIMQKYWAETPQERRMKLLPFFWSEIAAKGRIFGNRTLGSKVDNANPHWFSYPGYSEIFCGLADSAVNSNDYPPNPHTNVLEFLHKQSGFKGKVAAFGAWDAFDRILNEKRAGFPVICGPDNCGGRNPGAREQMINDLKRDAYSPFGIAEQLDVFTHYAALEYLKNRRPRVLYISYGETDEWAHHAHYRDYLDAAAQTDRWIRDIWNWVQSDPQYRNQTALFITTDHGRGDIDKTQWTSHGSDIEDSHEIWFAAMGPGLPAGGEMKQPVQLFQKQFAQTIAEWLGFKFKAEHEVAESVWMYLK